MSNYLLAISVGPVQDFIAAARKTRDLWFGSQVLSDISRAVAKRLAGALGTEGYRQLVFPAPDAPEQLDRPDLNVANVIVAEIPDGAVSDMRTLTTELRSAAQVAWRSCADDAWKRTTDALRKKIGHVSSALWEAQVDDVVEFYAAWVSFDPGNPQAYAAARRRVMQLLAGRKQCRDFQSAGGRIEDREGVPKSSLDGARESVVDKLREHLRGRLRLRSGEQLDSIGLTKRLAGGKMQYPSVSRVAADPWIRAICRRAEDDEAIKERLTKLRAELDKLADEDVLHRVPAPYVQMPYEGVFAYPNRYRELAEEAGWIDEKTGENTQPHRLDGLRTAVADLIKTIGEPDPYLAVLVADGDRIGAALSQITTADAHRRFSQQLTRFAGQAAKVVADHHGVLVYSGGDDVLAFVPVDRCVACARTLHKTFGEIMQGAIGSGNDVPTLSVGIAIGHFLEPLEFLLQYGRRAEKVAKEGFEPLREEQRNGLAVMVHARSGAPIGCRARWDDNQKAGLYLDQRIHTWVRLLLDGQLPHRAAYELRELGRTFANWPGETEQEKDALREAIQKAALRALQRKQAAGGEKGKQLVAKLLESVENAEQLEQVASELLVARRIHAAASFDPDAFEADARAGDEPHDESQRQENA